MNQFYKITGTFLAVAVFIIACSLAGAVLASCGLFALCGLLAHMTGNPDCMALLYLVYLIAPLGLVVGGLAGLFAVGIFLGWLDARPSQSGFPVDGPPAHGNSPHHLSQILSS